MRMARYHRPASRTLPVKRTVTSCGPDMGCCGPAFVHDLGDGVLTCAGWRDDWKMSAQSGFGRGTGIAWGFALPLVYRERSTTHGRIERIRQFGGETACEAAVSTALEWLKVNQNADGSWGQNDPCAMTGLALLAFLRRFETPESPFYGNTVLNGVKILIQSSPRHPRRLISIHAEGSLAELENAVSSCAMGEMYAAARLGSKAIPGMREAFEEGMKLIVANDKVAAPSDGVALAWSFQAVRAAKQTGLKIPGLHEALQLDLKQSLAAFEKGLDPETPASVLLVGLQCLTRAPDEALQRSLGELANPTNFGTQDLRARYFESLGLFQVGGDKWFPFEQKMRTTLLAAQADDGKFELPDSPLYDMESQCLSILMLESYYRFRRGHMRDEMENFICR